MANVVQIPKPILRELLEAGRKINIAQDALEDFLLTSNKDFIKKWAACAPYIKPGAWEVGKN